jgi:hypothetical protein
VISAVTEANGLSVTVNKRFKPREESTQEGYIAPEDSFRVGDPLDILKSGFPSTLSLEKELKSLKTFENVSTPVWKWGWPLTSWYESGNFRLGTASSPESRSTSWSIPSSLVRATYCSSSGTATRALYARVPILFSSRETRSYPAQLRPKVGAHNSALGEREIDIDSNTILFAGRVVSRALVNDGSGSPTPDKRPLSAIAPAPPVANGKPAALAKVAAVGAPAAIAAAVEAKPKGPSDVFSVPGVTVV